MIVYDGFISRIAENTQIIGERKHEQIRECAEDCFRIAGNRHNPNTVFRASERT